MSSADLQIDFSTPKQPIMHLVGPWKPVSEPPAEEGRYLTVTREDDGFNFYRIRAWSSDWSENPVWEGPGCEEVLYWMPLPPAPEGMEWK